LKRLGAHLVLAPPRFQVRQPLHVQIDAAHLESLRHELRILPQHL